jgi:hypothetical protein
LPLNKKSTAAVTPRQGRNSPTKNVKDSDALYRQNPFEHLQPKIAAVLPAETESTEPFNNLLVFHNPSGL